MKKRIDIELNLESIKNAQNELKKYEKCIKQINKEFFEIVCLWIIKKANSNIEKSTIGEDVKIEITNGWEYEIYENQAKIINTSQKAVFVEFGVGIVGSFNSHPKADIEGYSYNVINANSQPSKVNKGVWVFSADSEEEIDLRQGRYSVETRKNGKIKVITKGSTPVMYAYNAIIEAQKDLRNTNGELVKEWENLLERYFK